MKLNMGSINKVNQKIRGIERFAKGRILRGITKTQKSQARELLNAIDGFRNNSGSLKQTVEALRDIGEVAYKTKGTAAELPSDVKKLRDMYASINEAVIASVRSQIGDDIADSLVSNNKAMSSFFGETSDLSKIVGNSKIPDEKVFSNLILAVIQES